MVKKNVLFVGLIFFTSICFCEEYRYTNCDGTVYLQNGRKITGIVEKQKNNSILIRFKNGAMTLNKSEIKKIVYSGEKIHYSKVYKLNSEKVKGPYQEQIAKYSYKYNVSPALVSAVLKAESNFNPFNISCKGAKGLMQLMPTTAKCFNVNNVFDPDQNIDAGARYLSYLLDRFDNNFEKSVAAYNAGPNAVRKYGTVPPYKETENYVKKVKKYYFNYKNVGGVESFKDEKTGKLYFFNP